METIKAHLTSAAWATLALLSSTTVLLVPAAETSPSAPHRSCGTALDEPHHTRRVAPASLLKPPATCYGPVLADRGFAPTAGMPVTAHIDGNLCGQSETREVDAQITYDINMQAEGPGGITGCGSPGMVSSIITPEPLNQSREPACRIHIHGPDKRLLGLGLAPLVAPQDAQMIVR